MKIFASLMMAFLIVFTSCKKDKSPELLNATSVADIQKVILTGYWQLEKKGENEASLENVDYYDVFQVLNNKEAIDYDSKTVEDDKYFYKIMTVDNKTAWVSFSNNDDYEDNDYDDDDVYYVVLKEGKLVFTYKPDNEVTVYKRFNTIQETIDYIED